MIWKIFVDEMKDIKLVNFMGNYLVVNSEVVKVVLEVINGKGVIDLFEVV